ncbi:MAG TPA: glycosyltransferase, partial [Nitrosopumilaceae archaeon]|nr:glycosyltransferase [Nitrosopumilaceae archaeon]
MTLAIFIFNWLSEPLFSDQKTTPSTSVSIIIAARNEEKNIVMCIQNIIRQDYPFPLAELIIVDDNSTDTTIE